MKLFFLGPGANKVKALGQSRENTARDPIEDLFFLSLSELSNLLTHGFLALLELFIGKVEEIFVSYLKNLSLLTLSGEGSIEVSACECCNLRHRVKEGAVPEGENALQVWSKTPFSLFDESSKSQVGVLSDLLVMLIHNDAAEVVKEESEETLHLVRILLG